MRGEIETYSRELRWILDQIALSLRGLTPAQLNWRPPTGAANSADAIVCHVIGATRVYFRGFGCGLPARRDRSGEFAASGDDAEALVARVGRLSEDRAVRSIRSRARVPAAAMARHPMLSTTENGLLCRLASYPSARFTSTSASQSGRKASRS